MGWQNDDRTGMNAGGGRLREASPEGGGGGRGARAGRSLQYTGGAQQEGEHDAKDENENNRIKIQNSKQNKKSKHA